MVYVRDGEGALPFDRARATGAIRTSKIIVRIDTGRIISRTLVSLDIPEALIGGGAVLRKSCSVWHFCYSEIGVL